MIHIVIRLDPNLLDNPDLDVRAHLPDLIVERSGGIIENQGYDYVGEQPLMVLFLQASERGPALRCVRNVIEKVRLLDNDLRMAAVVAVEHEGEYDVIYPPDFEGEFLPKE